MSRLVIAIALWAGVAACAQGSVQEARRAYDRGDYGTALAQWRPLAEQGDPAAQTSLGLMHARGHGVPRDDAEAARWFRRAAEQGHAPAQRILGLAYRDGRGVPQDDAEAFRWLRQAAEQGDAIGEYYLAWTYFAGRGVPQDDAATVQWLRRAAGQGEVRAQSDLGFLYFQGRGVPQDDTEGVRWWRRAAEQGLALAQRNLAVAYRDGRGVPRDDREAVRWFERAAQGGDGGAMNDLGHMFHHGHGIPRDDAQAARWFRHAADQNLAPAQRNLGLMYLEGRGVPQDHAEAARWFRRAAEQNFALAQRNLGLAYLHGRGVPQDDAEAARWFRRAAEQDDPPAMTNLGFLYYTGRGVPQDDAEAARWSRRAADLGIDVAQRNLGIAYREGRGVPRDDGEAARWLRQAAMQGDAVAQLQFGQLHERGTGVSRDLVQAYVWYSLAATGLAGDAQARARAERDVVALLLAPDQLARAEALVQTWQPKPSPGPALEQSAAVPVQATALSGGPPAEPAKDLIPRKALFVPLADKPRVSPDGRRLAYLAPDYGIPKLWMRTLGAEDDRVVTPDRAHAARMFAWQCDGEHILSLQDRDGDEHWRLYQTDVKARTTRDLTPADGVRVTPVALNCRVPDQALFGVYLRTRDRPDVYRVHLQTGASAVDTENPGDVATWLADGELEVRAAASVSAEGGPFIRVRHPGRSPWRVLKQWSAGLVAFSRDGRSLQLLASADAPARRLLRADIETGAVTVLAEDPRHDVADVLLHPSTGEVQAVAFDRARREWTILDQSIRDDFDALRAVGTGNLDVVSRDRENRTWIVRHAADVTPPQYVLYDRATRRVTPLLRTSPAAEGFTLARMQSISFEAGDGMRLHGYLTLPVARSQPLPLVVLVHGGPWERDVWGWEPEVQWLANRGYAVLQVNFRGSTGYGRAYLDAGDREWGGKMLSDLVDGKAWAVRAGHADPRKVCIMGASYGGYATLSALTFVPDEFACGIAFAAPSDLTALVRSRWRLLKPFIDQRLGRIERDDALLKAQSPLFAVERMRAPLLMAHGANDPNVSRLESDQFVAAARARRTSVEYLVFDEGHGLVRPENRLRFYAAAEQFLAQHLGGRLEPPAPDEDWRPLRR